MKQSGTERGSIAFICIGSNLGDREQYCREALGACDAGVHTKVAAVSSLYESDPWGYREQGAFINCVARVETCLNVRDFMASLQHVEQSLGKRVEVRWGPRAIDIDLLFFNDEIIDEPDLKVPHPHLHQRRFVLVPLAEIAPLRVHPVLQQTAGELLLRVQDASRVVRISEIAK